MLRPLLVGMNNPVSMAPQYALYPAPEGHAGHRLWSFLNDFCPVSRQEYIRVFERVNLVVGDWNKRAAAEQATRMRAELQSRHVVLLGTQVFEAFGHKRVLDQAPYADPNGLSFGCTYYQVPHPSGRNIWYNIPENRQRVGRLLSHLYKSYAESSSEV